MAPLLTSRLTPLLTLAKIFGLNSSHSSTRSNKYLVLYSLALVVVYLTIFTLRILTTEREQIYTLNRVVTNLHLFCYIAIFFSDILSNWINSKSYCRALIRLEILDYQLRTVGYYPDCDKTRKMFYVSVAAASGLFLYVAIFDCLIDVFQTGEKIDFFFWLSIYLPITINYFSIFVIVFTFFLLNERYKCLEHVLNNISTRKLHMNVEQFTKFYLELTHISNSLVSQFSLQLSATFLFIFISITTNMYMVLKINLDLSQYILIFNFVLIHLGELVAVVLVSHWTTLRAENIVIASPKLLTSVSDSKTSFRKHLQAYFLMTENRLEARIFGMFCLEPSTLLSLTVATVSYLIILIQFTEPGSSKGSFIRGQLRTGISMKTK